MPLSGLREKKRDEERFSSFSGGALLETRLYAWVVYLTRVLDRLFDESTELFSDENA